MKRLYILTLCAFSKTSEWDLPYEYDESYAPAYFLAESQEDALEQGKKACLERWPESEGYFDHGVLGREAIEVSEKIIYEAYEALCSP